MKTKITLKLTEKDMENILKKHFNIKNNVSIYINVFGGYLNPRIFEFSYYKIIK